MAKKNLELPKLPKGMGAYEWKNENTIRYRKQVTYHGHTKQLSVSGKTIAEVNRLMKEKEEEFQKETKIAKAKSMNITLEQGMNDWLFLYKQEEVINRSLE